MPTVLFMFGQFRWHNGKREKMECLGVAVDGAGLKADKLFGFFAAEKFFNCRISSKKVYKTEISASWRRWLLEKRGKLENEFG